MQYSAFDLTEMYRKVKSIRPGLISEWMSDIRIEIEKLAANVQPASPFRDKPKFQPDPRRGRFWIKNVYKDGYIWVFGTSPNIARIKTFSAPAGKYHTTRPYVAHFFDNGKLWHTLHRAYDTTTDCGVKYKQPYYHGVELDEPIHVFGVKHSDGVWGYGRGVAYAGQQKTTQLWSEESFADWLMLSGDNEINRIIMETGNKILSKYI